MSAPRWRRVRCSAARDDGLDFEDSDGTLAWAVIRGDDSEESVVIVYGRTIAVGGRIATAIVRALNAEVGL